MATAISMKEVGAEVKWFNKGFGFVNLIDFPDMGDIFIHISKLEAGGFEPSDLEDGFWVEVDVENDDQGRLAVTKLHAVQIVFIKRADPAVAAEKKAAAEAAAKAAKKPVYKVGEPLVGIVAKVMPNGFGFMKVEGRREQIFFHNNARADATVSPAEGMTYTFVVGKNERGFYATYLEFQKTVVADTKDEVPEETPAVEAEAKTAPTQAEKLVRKVKRAPRKTAAQNKATAKVVVPDDAPDTAMAAALRAATNGKDGDTVMH